MEPQDQDRNRRGQFKPGVSGNPGGRPRGRPSITASLRLLADQDAEFKFDAPKGESWTERIARVLIERAAEGDLRAVSIVLERLDGKPVIEVPEEEIVIEEIAPA
jgi:hypothetical protein